MSDPGETAARGDGADPKEGRRLRVRAGVRSDIGHLRERNEDSYLVREPLFVVADGMGGHRGGDVASSLALEVIDRSAGRPGPEDADGDPFAALVEEIKEANREVLGRGEADGALRGMGTTITAVLAEPNRAHVAHVGDSRAYLLRDGTLQQLTEDHTLVQRMVREGRLRPEEAETHPQRSILTRALGVEDDIEVDQLTLDVHPGDRLVLCTDGLTTMVPKERIQEILATEADPQAACDLLVEAANNAGGDDNITVIVLDFLEEAAKATGDAETIVVASGGPPSPGDGSRSGGGGARRAESPSTVAEPDATARATGERPVAAKPARAGRRVRWGVVALWSVVGAVVIVGALIGLRLYVDGQWYVGDEGGRVAIYNGIPTTVLGFELSHVVQTTDIATPEATRLAPWRDLEDGITANSLGDARAILEQIRQDLRRVTETAPSPPPPTASPSGGGG